MKRRPPSEIGGGYESLILPLPKYRVLVRTDLPEWAQRSQTKMERTVNACYKRGHYSARHRTNPNSNSRAILTLSERLATGTLSLRDGGFGRLDSPSGIRARYARSTGALDAVWATTLIWSCTS
jgi:hypothetical protein